MRVIAGTARSIPLLTPEGMDTRPTTDRIKETLFNMLQFELQGAVFLDLFAGSGAIGIEALSRGAARAYFVDNGRKAAECIRKNLAKCHFEERSTLLQTDALSAVARLVPALSAAEKLIVFMDPPYDKGLELPVLSALSERGCLSADSLLVVEQSLSGTLPGIEAMGLRVVREKTYKNQKHVFLEKQV